MYLQHRSFQLSRFLDHDSVWFLSFYTFLLPCCVAFWVVSLTEASLFLFFFHLDVGYEYLTRSALKQSLITVLIEDQYLVADPLGPTLTLICDKYLPCFVSLPWRCVLHGLRPFRQRRVSFRIRVRSFRLISGWKNKVYTWAALLSLPKRRDIKR